MLKKIGAVLLLFSFFHQGYACDACSCTSMNSIDGQLLPGNRSFVGVSSFFVHQINDNKEKFNKLSYSLYAAYSFHKKWQILANLPMQQNVTVYTDKSKSSQVGLGDASFTLSYTPINIKALANHIMVLRAGVKLPTGYYNVDNTSNYNLGTKSVDFLFSSQYIFERKKQGFNVLFSARVNTTNKFEFKYGNQFNLTGFYFVKRGFKKQNYMPFFGAASEYILNDVSHQFIRNYSGGKAIYALGGLMWNINDQVAIFSKLEFPLYQDYPSIDGNIYTNVRAQIQLSYYIPQKQIFKMQKED